MVKAAMFYIRITLQALLPLILLALSIICFIAGIYYGVKNADMKTIVCLGICTGTTLAYLFGKWNQWD